MLLSEYARAGSACAERRVNLRLLLSLTGTYESTVVPAPAAFSSMRQPATPALAHPRDAELPPPARLMAEAVAIVLDNREQSLHTPL
jgi:hypothetical protein